MAGSPSSAAAATTRGTHHPAGEVGGCSGEPHPVLSRPSLTSGKYLAWVFLRGSVLPCPFLPAFPLPWYQEIP